MQAQDWSAMIQQRGGDESVCLFNPGPPLKCVLSLVTVKEFNQIKCGFITTNLVCSCVKINSFECCSSCLSSSQGNINSETHQHGTNESVLKYCIWNQVQTKPVFILGYQVIGVPNCTRNITPGFLELLFWAEDSSGLPL